MSERIALFLAGMQKAGTTSLDAYLRRHPSLSGATVKETHFFDDESVSWDAPPYERLHAFYPPAQKGVLRFEATPATSFWAPALQRIQRYNSSARIVLLLRDPTERAWSHWCMEFHRGTETLPFAEAIRSGRQRLDQARLDVAWRNWSYVERGFYGEQLRRARALFPDGQLLFLESDALRSDPAGTLARIAAFAGIDAFPDVPDMAERGNPLPGLCPRPDDVTLLQATFAADCREAVALAGIDARHWPTLATDASRAEGGEGRAQWASAPQQATGSRNM